MERILEVTVVTSVKTARDMFYNVNDVMAILGYSRSKSYKVIAKLNRELEEKGKCVRGGMVIKRYFDERFGFEPAGKERK